MRPSSEAFLYASSASRICARARRSSVSRARVLATSASGRAIEARVATIAAVMSTSMSVNPRALFIRKFLSCQRQTHRRRQLRRDHLAGVAREGHRLQPEARCAGGVADDLEDELRQLALPLHVALCREAQVEPPHGLRPVCAAARLPV